MQETGYGSDRFLRACATSLACREIEGQGLAASWGRFRAGSLSLARYERSLPVVPVRLTEAPAGRMIAEHLAIREDGRFRYRGTQGVLRLPANFGSYLRGRHRQAVRTNVGHARRAGLTVTSTELEIWRPGPDDTRRDFITPGPIEWWQVRSADIDQPAAEAILSVDEEVALLHGLGSRVGEARWLIHTAIVERLCGKCRVLLVNSDDAYLLGEGHRYFQRLLGYEVVRLELPRPRRSRIASRWSGSKYLTASRMVTPEARAARGSSHS